MLSCLLLAACGETATPPKQTSNEPNVLPPGLWEVSRSLLSQQVGEEEANVAMEAVPKREAHCFEEPVTRAATLNYLMGVEGAACEPVSSTFRNGRITASVSCTPPPTHRSNLMSVAGTYTHRRFSVEVEQKAVAVPPGQNSQTRTAVDGRRLGDC